MLVNGLRSRPSFDYGGLSNLELARERCDPMLHFGYEPPKFVPPPAFGPSQQSSLMDFLKPAGQSFGAPPQAPASVLERDRPRFDYSGLSSLETSRERCDPMLHFGYEPPKFTPPTYQPPQPTAMDYVRFAGQLLGAAPQTDTPTLQRDMMGLYLLGQAGAFK
jgi:hypothetical protein